MKLHQETPQHFIYLDYFQGKQVRILKDKVTGAIFFNSDDMAKVMGFKDHNDMIANPQIQATVSENKLNNGKPIFTEILGTQNLN